MLKDITNILNNPEQREKYINKVSSNLFKKPKTLKNKKKENKKYHQKKRK